MQTERQEKLEAWANALEWVRKELGEVVRVALPVVEPEARAAFMASDVAGSARRKELVARLAILTSMRAAAMDRPGTVLR